MKVATHVFHAVAALVLLSTDVSAQDLSGIPACATSCVTKLLGSSGCSNFDYQCICSSQSFISDISCCILPVCSQAELASAITFADTLCARFGVTTLPQSAVCPSTTASAATASSTTGSVSSPSPSTAATSTAQVPSCYNADPSATTPCVLPVPLTATSTTNSAAAASSISAAISSSLSSESASAASAGSSVAAAVSSSLAAASSTVAAALTTTMSDASVTAATTTAASTGVGSLNGVKGMGVAGAVVGAAAGVMGVLL